MKLTDCACRTPPLSKLRSKSIYRTMQPELIWIESNDSNSTSDLNVDLAESKSDAASQFLYAFFAELKRRREAGEESDSSSVSKRSSSLSKQSSSASRRSPIVVDRRSEKWSGGRADKQRCRLCDREFKDLTRFRQHFKDKHQMHQMLADDDLGEKDSTSYHCELCQVTTIGLITMEMHLGGKKHLAVYQQVKSRRSAIPEHLIPVSLWPNGVKRSSRMIAELTAVDRKTRDSSTVVFTNRGKNETIVLSDEERSVSLDEPKLKRPRTSRY